MNPVNKSLRISIIGPAHPLRGGLASFNERMARAFMSEGHTVNIYTFSLQYPGFLFPGTTQYSSEPAPSDLDIRVCINSVNPLNWLRVGRKLKREKPDLIIVRYWLPFMGPCLGTILRLATGNGHTKIVCIADNIIPHEKRPGDTAFTRYFVKPVDAFITMSEKVLKDLSLFSGKPARYIAHPLYDNFGEPVSQLEARKTLGIAADDYVFLFFGFIRRYKGLDILLDAFAALLKKADEARRPNIKLLVAGEFYEDKSAYEQQIQSLQISNNLVLRTEFIPDSAVRLYLCAADAVVQPYRQATQSGVTPLAYHFNIPMIVTNVGGLPAMVPEGRVGLIAEPNAVDLSNKMARMMETGKEHFLPFMEEEKKKYSWSALVQAITGLAFQNKQ
ncbi:MAG TPA: glycosyl transferase family 1 [Chitinophagaceae bacterium]|nr:glycosyl transferase family 1 [Chitinophagaceae bacterium]HCY89961.1 glycosyl transferase family 1 [Chitinophagaceae bacterium]HRF26061.1 glycosyltransferase [Ferruginibacter sp.]